MRASVLAVTLSLVWAGGASGQDEAARQLAALVAALDSALFDAFNACDVAGFAAVLAEDLEFFHDTEGFMTKKGLVDSFEGGCVQRRKGEIPRVRRELVGATVQAYPVKGYGAVQAGEHRFYELAAGQKDKLVGTAKFLHVWKKQDGGWKLARAASYDHMAVPYTSRISGMAAPHAPATPAPAPRP